MFSVFLKQQHSTNLLIGGQGGICCAQEPLDEIGGILSVKNHHGSQPYLTTCHQSIDWWFLTDFCVFFGRLYQSISLNLFNGMCAD